MIGRQKEYCIFLSETSCEDRCRIRKVHRTNEDDKDRQSDPQAHRASLSYSFPIRDYQIVHYSDWTYTASEIIEGVVHQTLIWVEAMR
jgi:hypothetical protein